MDIKKAIRDHVRESGRHPFDINQGDCGDFAYDLSLAVSGAHHLDSGQDRTVFGIDADLYNLDDDHGFIEFEGRFYDAEAPDGVERPEYLPIFMRNWGPALFKSARRGEKVCVTNLKALIDECIALALGRKLDPGVIKLLQEARERLQ